MLQLQLGSLSLLLSLSLGGASRQSLSLDGEWDFALVEPSAAGAGFTNQSGTILVPGAWQSQGYGNSTSTMKRQVLTGEVARMTGTLGAVGIYTKTVAVPPCATTEHRHVFTVDRGIHRHAFFKIAGRVVGEHRGYLTPFEADVTDAVTGGRGQLELEVALDGGRQCDKGGCADALMGAQDDDTDGTGIGGWAGLNGHVAIECRPPVFIDGGVGSIVQPHVQHPPVTTASAGKPLDVSVSFVVSGGSAPAAVEIFDNASGTPLKVGSATSRGAVAGNVSLNVTVPAVKLWSPSQRSLYTAVVSIGPAGAAFDSASARFGVRTVVTDGHKLMLNGNRVYLAGYGDDAVYPLTVAPPRTKAEYAGKLQFARTHGFNFVRHHSHTLPTEYFAAADEAGVMISPELPCAYGSYFGAANATGQELYLASWASYVAALRNHPSILVWTLCNEMYMGATFVKDGVTFGAERFHAVKQALDPARLMNDQDGACGSGSVRDSLSFCSLGFDVFNLGCIGIDTDGSCIAGENPTKYHGACNTTTGDCPGALPALPIISHETGNYNTYPRLESLIAEFERSGTTIRPFWLTPARDRLNASGLLSETEAWATASEQLYVLCWKMDIEDQRHNSMLSGYEWWLLQDYWTGNNGIVDTFMRPKPGVADRIKGFNAQSIFLSMGLALSYVSNDTLSCNVSLSNFGDGALPASTKLSWAILLDGKVIKAAVVPVLTPVPQGEVGLAASIEFALPDVGTTASVVFGTTDGPRTITVTAAFAQDGGSFAAAVPGNSWNATLFPRWVSAPSPGNGTTPQPVEVTDPIMQGRCGFDDCTVTSLHRDPASPPAVILTRSVSSALLQSAAAGSVVLLLQDATSTLFPSTATRFKQAWWLGLANDQNAGTLVYGSSDAILGGMAAGGAGEMYAGKSWYRMVEGAQTFLLDDMYTLPGAWSGASDGVYSEGTCPSVGCPADYPFPYALHEGTPLAGNICYTTAAEAATGSGACGSWCTKDVNVGIGCGDNSHRICGPSSPKPASRSLWCALLTPQVNPGSFYRCGKRT